MADTPDPPRPQRGLDDLRSRIERARGAGRKPEPSGEGGAEATSAGLATALRLSSELVAGVVVGGGLGWAFDRWLGTSPIGLVAFVLIGFAAGTVNLVRAAARKPGGPGREGS